MADEVNLSAPRPKRSLSSPLLDEPVKGLVHKVVLTGGPCGGKTTSCARLRTFFENIGWKVFVVPETATILLGGGVTFSELTIQQANKFQENLLKTVIQLESVYWEMSEMDEEHNVLIVCDRGAMDPSAFCERSVWLDILKEMGVTEIDLRDKRYDQVIHLETAANGAEKFYSLATNSTRTEPVAQAIERDLCAAKAWVGHPYYDFIDNSSGFEQKIRRVIEAVCTRLTRRFGIILETERLSEKSQKRKFLVSSIPSLELFPNYSDFEVRHDYLKSSDPLVQVRVRQRGKGGHYMFTYTIVKTVGNERAEARKQITHREYELFLTQRDLDCDPIFKTRYCFVWKGNYFQLDVYTDRNPDRCKGLIFLETFTDKLETLILPDFLDISREVTGIKEYSMYHLAAHESTRSQKGPQSNGIGTAEGNKEVTPSSLSPGLQ